jgi:mono/diheme cytochrome c family protein
MRPGGQRGGTGMRRIVIVLAVVAPVCAAARAQTPNGGAIFYEQCAACHQREGQGLPGQFPPLAGNPDLFLARDFPARVVLFGMSGKIHVRGQAIDGTMPPLGDLLDDGQIAAVVNYVRGAFGNAALPHQPMAPLDAATVAGLRKQKGALSDQVYAYRKALKAAAK